MQTCLVSLTIELRRPIIQTRKGFNLNHATLVLLIFKNLKSPGSVFFFKINFLPLTYMCFDKGNVDKQLTKVLNISSHFIYKFKRGPDPRGRCS